MSSYSFLDMSFGEFLLNDVKGGGGGGGKIPCKTLSNGVTTLNNKLCSHTSDNFLTIAPPGVAYVETKN